MTTLDSDEIAFVRSLFKDGDVKSDGRIGIAEVLACLEKMDYIMEGSPEDLIRSVVPAAVEVDRFSLNDTIKVATAAKAQDQGPGAPKAPGICRDDSLAELERSFNKQLMLGHLKGDVIEEEPTAASPGLGREDSLAQLESSFHKQVLSGHIPAAIVEGPDGLENGDAPPSRPTVGLDIPKRRRTIAGVYPNPPSPPSVAPRGASFSAIQGPEPVMVNDLPKRRTYVVRPGGGSLVGLHAEGRPSAKNFDDDTSTLPASPELWRQSSELELLETAGDLGVEPVEPSPVPKRRRSFAVSQDWLEAAAQETAKALEAKKVKKAKEAEAERQRAEAEKILAETESCLQRLIVQVEHKAAIAGAREEAKQLARAAALQVERAEAAAARIEVETVLRLAVESLERDAAVAEAREEAERKAAEAALAREAAEKKAAEEGVRADEALRLVAEAEERARAKEESLREAARVKAEEEKLEEEKNRAMQDAARLKSQEEDTVKEGTRRALEEELELLRSKVREAAEEAAERAQAEAQARDQKEAEALVQAEERARREARLAAEVESAAQREIEAREAGQREAKAWEEKFQALQREREEQAQRAKEDQDRAVAAAVEEAREFEKNKERHPLDGADVSYEDVDFRDGKQWWQCVFCAPDASLGSGEDTSAKRKSFLDDDDDDDDYDAAVSGMKPEMWIKSSGNSASTRSMDRPRKTDVCTVS